MQTTSNYSPSVMPFVSRNTNLGTSYFIFPKKLYKHLISFGLSVSDILDYNKLRSVFSQRDMAELQVYNSHIFAGKLYSKLYVNAGSGYNPVFNYEGAWKELTANQKAEYENVILPMADTLIEEIKETKVNSTFNADTNSWTFYPLSNPQYYLIVVDDSFLSDLRIRSKCKTFVSECLQHDINLIGLDITQGRSLYGFYIRLLQLEIQHIETL